MTILKLKPREVKHESIKRQETKIIPRVLLLRYKKTNLNSPRIQPTEKM